jgi:hypothetical protein
MTMPSMIPILTVNPYPLFWEEEQIRIYGSNVPSPRLCLLVVHRRWSHS